MYRETVDSDYWYNYLLPNLVQIVEEEIKPNMTKSAITKFKRDFIIS